MSEKAQAGQSDGIEALCVEDDLTPQEALALYEVLQRRVAAEHDFDAYGCGWAKLRARAQEASA